MLRFYPLASLIWVLLFASACSTGHRSDVPLRAPAPAQKSMPPTPAAGATGGGAKLGAGEFAVQVDSEPAGGIVVVNGVPVGRTPQRVILAGTSRGFFRDTVSIKVRFVAADTDHTSQTVEEILTPLDKIPACVHFSATGVTRGAR